MVDGGTGINWPAWFFALLVLPGVGGDCLGSLGG